MLKEIDVADVSRFETELFEYLTAVKSDLLATIRETGNLSDESEAELKEAILTVKEKF
jgi:F-type H+-transporting ATPase subunit alpha